MRLIRLAIRNLGRSRFRTILSIVAVALGVLVVILTKSLIDGMLDSIITSTVRLTAGHIRIIDPEYRKKEQLLSLNYPVGGLQEHEGVSDLVRQLELLSSVRVAAPRIRFVAMASHGEMLEGVMGVAVDPEREELVARLSRFMGEGRLPQPGSREVVLGGELLLDLGMLVGDKVDLVFTTAYGAMRAATFGVVGEFASGLAYLDKATAYIPLDTAQDLLAMGDTATEVVVMAVSERRIAQTLSQVRALLPGTPAAYTATPWYQHSGYVSYIKMAGAAYDIIYLFILGLASFVIANTMVMVVNERTREIGMMAALGLAPKQVLHLFLLEGTITGVLGATLGTMVGGVAAALLAREGIPLEGMGGIDSRLFIMPRMYPLLNWQVLAYALLAGTAMAALVTYLPARRAARLEPTDALRMS